jgi:hypothetical protein
MIAYAQLDIQPLLSSTSGCLSRALRLEIVPFIIRRLCAAASKRTVLMSEKEWAAVSENLSLQLKRFWDMNRSLGTVGNLPYTAARW